MADNIKDFSQNLFEKVKNIDFNFQGNIVLTILIALVLLWGLSIISPTFIILFFIALNIYGLYFLYKANYLKINLDNFEFIHEDDYLKQDNQQVDINEIKEEDKDL